MDNSDFTPLTQRNISSPYLMQREDASDRLSCWLFDTSVDAQPHIDPLVSSLSSSPAAERDHGIDVIDEFDFEDDLAIVHQHADVLDPSHHSPSSPITPDGGRRGMNIDEDGDVYMDDYASSGRIPSFVY